MNSAGSYFAGAGLFFMSAMSMLLTASLTGYAIAAIVVSALASVAFLVRAVHERRRVPSKG